MGTRRHHAGVEKCVERHLKMSGILQLLLGLFTGMSTFQQGTILEMSPITANSSASGAHGLPNLPLILQIQIVCLSADQGYSAGDVVVLQNVGWAIKVDVTNLSIYTSSAPIAPPPSGGGAAATLDKTKWKLQVIPYGFA